MNLRSVVSNGLHYILYILCIAEQEIQMLFFSVVAATVVPAIIWTDLAFVADNCLWNSD